MSSLPPISYTWYIYAGWVGIGWQQHCKTRLSLRELDSQGAVSFPVSLRLPPLAVKIDHFCAGAAFTPHKGDDRIT